MRIRPLRSALLAACLLALFSSSTLAQGSGIYIGVKGGSTDVESSLGDAFDQVLDGDEDSLTYEVGYRIGRFLSVEAAYHDLGDIPGTAALTPCPPGAVCPQALVPIEGETTAVSVSIVPRLPLTRRLSAFGKVGLVAWESDVGDALDEVGDLVEDFDDEDLIYGLGVQFDILGSLGIVGEWEEIAGDIETISFGIRLSFF